MRKDLDIDNFRMWFNRNYNKDITKCQIEMCIENCDYLTDQEKYIIQSLFTYHMNIKEICSSLEYVSYNQVYTKRFCIINKLASYIDYVTAEGDPSKVSIHSMKLILNLGININCIPNAVRFYHSESYKYKPIYQYTVKELNDFKFTKDQLLKVRGIGFKTIDQLNLIFKFFNLPEIA